MTTFGVPSGPPGTGPSGPAGPRPSKPSGPQPSAPRQPSGPPPPTKSDVDAFLVEIADLLIGVAARRALLRLPADPIEQTGQNILSKRLALTIDAVADLLAYQSPARRDHASAAVGADAIATPGGPAQAARVPPGECLTPGSGAAAGTAVTESAEGFADLSAGASSALPRADRAGEPPLPGTGTFSLPPTPAVRPFPERTEPFVLGIGVPYDCLPPADVRPFRERINP